MSNTFGIIVHYIISYRFKSVEFFLTFVFCYCVITVVIPLHQLMAKNEQQNKRNFYIEIILIMFNFSKTIVHAKNSINFDQLVEAKAISMLLGLNITAKMYLSFF